jgi:mannose-6-phosphate isomerase-like protein (cupin superfamily)
MNHSTVQGEVLIGPSRACNSASRRTPGDRRGHAHVGHSSAGIVSGDMKSAHLTEIEPVKIRGKLSWHPIRRTLGIRAFGINAYTANTGQEVIEAHNETGPGAGHHEEAYVVVAGRATFTVNGAEHDAPAGTILFLDDPPRIAEQSHSRMGRRCLR